MRWTTERCVSSNFIQRQFCLDEMNLFLNKLAAPPDEHRRIFRVDKREVANDVLPPHLRNVYSLLFYRKDPEPGDTAEYDVRRKPRGGEAWEIAIRRLANEIVDRLRELNPLRPGEVGKPALGLYAQQVAAAAPLVPMPANTPVRTMFVAKPAFDVVDAYRNVVKELRLSSIAVVPPPDDDMPHERDHAGWPSHGLDLSADDRAADRIHQ